MSVGAARGRRWRERVMRGVLVGSSDVPFTLVTAGWVGCTHNASRRNTATAKRRGDIGLPAIPLASSLRTPITRPAVCLRYYARPDHREHSRRLRDMRL